MTHHVSDDFMSIYIVYSERQIKRIKDNPEYIESEEITPLSILNFEIKKAILI